MRRVLGPSIGIAIGCIIAIGTIFGLGAAADPKRPFARYVVVTSGADLLITDNLSEQLFVYEPSPDGQEKLNFELSHIYDLSRVGEKKLLPIEHKAP